MHEIQFSQTTPYPCCCNQLPPVILNLLADVSRQVTTSLIFVLLYHALTPHLRIDHSKAGFIVIGHGQVTEWVNPEGLEITAAKRSLRN